MPLFEYVCTGCGATFEQLVRSTSNAQAIVCPQCKGTETKKLLSGFAVTGATASGGAAANCAPTGT